MYCIYMSAAPCKTTVVGSPRWVDAHADEGVTLPLLTIWLTGSDFFCLYTLLLHLLHSSHKLRQLKFLAHHDVKILPRTFLCVAPLNSCWTHPHMIGGVASILHICHFFTQAKLLEYKIYTEKRVKNLHGRRPWRPWQIWGMPKSCWKHTNFENR